LKFMAKRERIINVVKLPKNLKKANVLVPVLVVLLVGAAFYIGKLSTELKFLKGGALPSDQAAPVDNSAELAKAVDRPSDGDHIRGNKDAKIAIIEYSDYQCPYCQQFHPVMQQAVAELGDSIMWIYRHWPIEQIHPFAMPAAIASECVAELADEDAFWTFTDTDFENQELLSLEQIDEWALASGINAAQYETCKAASGTEDKVNADLQSGANAGIQGTPGSIVLNLDSGEVNILPGAVSFEQVKAAVESFR